MAMFYVDYGDCEDHDDGHDGGRDEDLKHRPRQEHITYPHCRARHINFRQVRNCGPSMFVYVSSRGKMFWLFPGIVRTRDPCTSRYDAAFDVSTPPPFPPSLANLAFCFVEFKDKAGAPRMGQDAVINTERFWEVISSYFAQDHKDGWLQRLSGFEVCSEFPRLVQK